jgi:hypothetical protein
MKAKKVNEFEQGGNPFDKMGIGKTSPTERQKVFDYLQNTLGLKFWYENVQFNKEHIQTHFLENIYQIEEDVNILRKVGIDISECDANFDEYRLYRIGIPKYDIIDGNRTVYSTIFKEDAETVIKTLQELTLTSNYKDQFKIEYSTGNLGRKDFDAGNIPDKVINIATIRRKYKNI